MSLLALTAYTLPDQVEEPCRLDEGPVALSRLPFTPVNLWSLQAFFLIVFQHT